MWEHFLSEWNGISLFLDPHLTADNDLEFWTDSSGTIGFGGYFKNSWFQGRWPEKLWQDSDDEMSMAFLELFPIVVAADLWGHRWNSKRILLHCDNQAVVNILQKGRSRKPRINKLMRHLTLSAAQNNYLIIPRYIPTKENVIADALSRFNFQRFRRSAPNADCQPTEVPDKLYALLTP